MRCDQCRYWDKNAAEVRWAGVSECTKPKPLWQCSEWEGDDGADNYRRVILPKYENMKMFVQDGSDFRAHLLTRPDFFCAEFDGEDHMTDNSKVDTKPTVAYGNERSRGAAEEAAKALEALLGRSVDVTKLPDIESRMDDRTKRVAQAICQRERGPISKENGNRCKACRDAEDGKPDGCLGLGYEYLAVVALDAAG